MYPEALKLDTIRHAKLQKNCENTAKSFQNKQNPADFQGFSRIEPSCVSIVFLGESTLECLGHVNTHLIGKSQGHP